MFLNACPLPGETRADDVVPAHPNAIPLSQDRWLFLYSTRGFQAVDDERSIVYQIRADTLDGPVLREGWIARARDDWDPFGRGERLRKEHGHPVAFGVPMGARIGGRPAPHAGLCVIKWRVCGRAPVADPKRSAASRVAQGVEWMQGRLNAAGDDLEILQPAGPLRQKGCETGERFCGLDRVAWMNQSFVQAVPFNAAADEWVDVNHFDGGILAALKYRYNPRAHRYEWTETGPALRARNGSLSEASLVRTRDGWLIAARGDPGPIRWFSSEDPFEQIEGPFEGDFSPRSPISLYTAPDGSTLLFTGNPAISPHRNARDPLYCFEADLANGFRVREPRVVFDSVAAGLGFRAESVPRVDMGKLVSHAGGRRQFILHRVRTKSINVPANTPFPVTEAEKRACGIYLAEILYAEDLPGAWRFATPHAAQIPA